MKPSSRHFTIFGKTLILLVTVTVVAFVAVLVLASLGQLEQPTRIVLVVGAVLAFVSAGLFVGIWRFLLLPLSVLADKLDNSGVVRAKHHHDTTAIVSDENDVLERIENKTVILNEVAEDSELAVKRAEAVFSQILSNSNESICRIDCYGHFLLCDDGFVSALGFDTSEDLIADCGNSFVHLFQNKSRAERFLSRLIANSEATERLVYLRCGQGSSLCVDLFASAIRDHDNEIIFLQINLSDASRLTSMASELEEAREFQRLFSSWTELLLQENEETDLTISFCRLLVENGGYKLAWIGAVLDEGDYSVRPVAVYGTNMGYVHGLQRSWTDEVIEYGPVAAAIRNGQPASVRDVQSLEKFQSHRQEFVNRDIGSILVIPLQVDLATSGVLVIYSGSTTAFAENEVNWLVELASSMSMGVAQLRDRKILQKAEKAKSRAERNYREIFDNAVEGMIQLSPDQQIINANFATAHILGFQSIEELLRQGENVGRNLLALQARAQEELQDEGSDSVGGRQEIQWIGADKEQVWLSVSLHPNLDSQGHITRYDGVMSDVTDDRLTKANLRKLSRALEQSPVAVMITDINGDIEYVNNKFSVVSGYRPEEVLGKKPSILKSGYTSGAEYSNLWRTVSNGGEWQGEFHNRKKNGELFWEAVSISPIRDARGQITHYLAVKEDVTKAKAADEALRQTGAHLETILNNIVEGIVSADENGVITGFNAAAETMFGYSAEGAIGQTISRLAGDGPQGELHTRIFDSFRLEQNSPYFGHVIEVTGRHSDGTQFPLEISVGVALTKTSRVFLGTYRDISERKEIERERQELGERLVNSQKLESVGQLAGGIAHDFNNILTPIVGYVELAKRSVEEETQVYKDLVRIERSARRARELTTKILNFSRPAATEVQPTELVSIVAEAVDMVRITAGSDVEIEWVDESENPIVSGDPSQLSQIVMSLVTNARQAIGDAKGHIQVRLDSVDDARLSNQASLKYQTGKYVRMRIEDDGPGMDEEILSKIFEPFFTTKPTGTGLGMATVMGIVNGMEGAIDVHSEPGKGTIIDIYLPRSNDTKSADNLPVYTGELIAGDEHIMFVDDETEHTDLARRMLENYGYTVTPMDDSEAALKDFKSRPDDFDLVVTDQMMPKLSGHELALAMWEVRPELPIVAISGYSKNVSASNASKLGYQDFLAKPFDLKSLVTAVRRSLDEQG